MHSLNPSVDLKPGDLRRRLLEHCTNPRGVEQTLQRAEPKLESPFERDVLARLVRAGYRVTPQWPVGHYRIDLVVEGGGRRLAVECDGDRFHPLEKLPEDMARQAILERLGWRFVRLRGSAFFRDPEAAMAPLFAKLRELEIPPEGEDAVTAEGNAEAALRMALVQRAEALQREWADPQDEARLLAQPPAAEADAGPLSLPQPAAAVVRAPAITETRAPQEAAQLPLSLSLSASLTAAAGGSLEHDDEREDAEAGDAASRSRTRAAPPARRRDAAAPRTSSSAGRTSADPLHDAVKTLLPADAFTCSDCGASRQLCIGKRGPFLDCTASGCEGRDGVAVETLAQALRQLAAKCPCHSPVRVADGRAGHPILVCTDAPTCTQNLAWRDFRDRLRNQSR